MIKNLIFCLQFTVYGAFSVFSSPWKTENLLKTENCKLIIALSASLSAYAVQQTMKVAAQRPNGVVQRRLQGGDDLGDERIAAGQGCQSLDFVSADELALRGDSADKFDVGVLLGKGRQGLGRSYLVARVKG